MNFRPLANRTILITRAAHQADGFRHELESYGARVVMFPTIEIAAPDSYAELDAAIQTPPDFDWIIFTSVNAVEYFMRRLTILNHDVSEFDDVRVCAIGEATANSLRDYQVHVDVVPPTANSESIIAALEDYLGAENAFAGLRFLIPRAKHAREVLPRELATRGANVKVVVAYQNILPPAPDKGRIAAMLHGEAIDCVTFTSASSLHNFTRIFANHRLDELLKGVVVACLGDITAQAAAAYNLQVNIIPETTGIEAFAATIADYFRNQ